MRLRSALRSPQLRRIAVGLLAVVVVLVVFSAGAWVGVRKPQDLPPILRDRIVDPSGPGALLEGYDFIQDRYYKRPSPRQLADDGLTAMVKGLDDPFSRYLDPADLKRFQQQQRNQVVGIGVLVSGTTKGLLVSHVYGGSPAKRVGIRSGDLIVAVGRRSLKGLDADHASRLVRGPAGTPVRLTVHRGSGSKERTLRLKPERAAVRVPIVTSRLVRRDGKRVGVVRLDQFTDGAGPAVHRALDGLTRRGADRFVLDLRANPGGQVGEAQEVASLFLKGGTVVTLRGRAIRNQIYRAGDHPAYPRQPLVVLVDRGTASAAEIVSGALQDRGRARLVGTRTYGKGVFQQVLQLAAGGALDITSGQYFTPKGRNLGGHGTERGAGLEPDVPLDADARKGSHDLGVDGAIDVVTGARRG